MTQDTLERTFTCPDHISVIGAHRTNYERIISKEALTFLGEMHKRFNKRRKNLLEERKTRQREIDKGVMPNFLPDTKHIRESDWKVAPIPEDLLDRRVEITGPVDRKMIINALNSGAKVFMADFEDSNTPSWTNNIEGHINLMDAIRRKIDFVNPDNGKSYSLNDEIATLIVRPRGWHLEEKHILFDDEPMSGSLVDFGLYLFHNANQLMENGTGPYFYLPKLESHLEARLWNDVFVFAQEYLGIPKGTIKATVLIETILASFELNEIIYELKDHMAGLNCGRWDYIFSYIKKFRNLEGFVLPERAQVTMTVPFMRSYAQLVIKTCHQRGAMAIGGMAAQIPIKNNTDANEIAINKVKEDKLREVKDGHDGTWVAHPGLVPVALEIFDTYMPEKNQLSKKRNDVHVTAADLVEVPDGTITENGLRMNINVGVLYIESWLRGVGCAALYNLMEDAATAEISRTQIWQWIKNKSKLMDGRTITYELFKGLLKEELDKIKDYVGHENYEKGRFPEAISLFDKLVKSEEFIDFLTLPAYEEIE